MKIKKFQNYGRHLVDHEDIKSVLRVLKGDLLTQGPFVKKFENKIAQLCNARYAVAVSSCTAGLHLACLAAGLGKDDTAITQGISFVASANAILYSGAKLDLVDINSDTLNMSIKDLKKKIKQNKRIKVIIPVHFSGLASHSKEIKELCKNKIIIEDAAHSLGAKYECGKPVGCGAYSDMTVFSFHPIKVITSGEGGIIVTNNKLFSERLKRLRTHGIERVKSNFVNNKLAYNKGRLNSWYYEQHELGFNYRLSDIHASLGFSQTKKLKKYINIRKKIALMYDKGFSNNPNLTRPQSSKSDRLRSGHHLYIIKIDYTKNKGSREKFMDYLGRRNIGTQVHYIPIYHQPFYKKQYSFNTKKFRQCEEYYKCCLSIPIHPGLKNQEIKEIIDIINSAANR